MLLRFAVQNHRSIHRRQELSMVASSLNDSDAGLIDTGTGVRVVPAAVIYGANASGKSNVISALHWMCRAVLLSHRQGEPGGALQRRPFALDPSAADEPTQCEVDFVVSKKRYKYGFAATNAEFISEWLYAFPNDHRQVCYQRKRLDFKFGRSLKGKNRAIADLTRPNSLFLSAATQNAHNILSSIASWFHSLMLVAETDSTTGEFDDRKTKTVDERVIDFLRAINSGVAGYMFEEVENVPSIFSFLLKDSHFYDLHDAVSTRKHKLKLLHDGRMERAVGFAFEDESDGTRRLISLLIPIFESLGHGSPMTIDELSASLHTQACEGLLALFSTSKTNPKGAQLIATTHDTNLLHSPLLRRDQIWFTEKDREGATHLYPLTDIRTRKGDNIERGYLQGRYGAIPFAGSPDTLFAAE